MQKSITQILLSLVMIFAATAGFLLIPQHKMADDKKINLETMIPRDFADWKVREVQESLVQAPDIEKTLNKLYTGILMRTYENSRGQQIMLSIAYGPDQRDNMGKQVHKPEICYPAQGFVIIQQRNSQLNTQFGAFPTRQLVAKLNDRIEPMTYWITIGNQAVKNNREFKLNQIKYGLRGQIADGMIVRVSTLGTDYEQAYQVQDEFVKQLLQALKPNERQYLGAHD